MYNVRNVKNKQDWSQVFTARGRTGRWRETLVWSKRTCCGQSFLLPWFIRLYQQSAAFGPSPPFGCQAKLILLALLQCFGTLLAQDKFMHCVTRQIHATCHGTMWGQSKVVVIVLASFPFHKLLTNWICHARRVGISFLVIPLDPQLHELLKLEGIPHLPQPDLSDDSIVDFGAACYRVAVCYKVRIIGRILSLEFNTCLLTWILPSSKTLSQQRW
jgi:hypothetical protein